MPNPTPPTKRKLKTTTPAYQGETAEPTVKPTPIPSDGELDKVAAENPLPKTSIPSLSPTSQGGGLVRGGTEAVAAYQRKLNSMGANLTVDGAWGEKTQAAFTQFQGKATPTIPKVRKKGGVSPQEAQANMDWAEQGKPKVKDYTKMDFLTSPTPTPTKRKVVTTPKPSTPDNSDPYPYTPSTDYGVSDTQQWYDRYKEPELTSPSGQKGKKVGGYQIYPNGRTKTPGGTMRNGSLLPRRKLATGK